MAKGNITIRKELRPCMVSDKKALFHRWCQWYEPVCADITVGGRPAGQAGGVAGLVEYEDGRVARAIPEIIRFLDNPFTEYNFSERREDA